MNLDNKSYLSLSIWIVALIAIGSIIGSVTQSEITSWYSLLQKSNLTPPNYIFPIVWTILYGIIGACGWLIWQAPSFKKLTTIKTLYVMHLILNWSWTPLFFHYHLIGLSLLVLIFINIIVGMIIWQTYQKIKTVSLLMMPYLCWILFAGYLNFYIWQYN